MSDACSSLQKTIASMIAGAAPEAFPAELARHLNACETCQDWLDAQEEGGDDPAALEERLAPLLFALAELEADAGPSPTQLALAEARDADERRVEEAVRGFIARHPSLDPSAHGIPMERYEIGMFFSALNAVNMLIRRIVGRNEPEPASYGYRLDGAIFIDGKLRVPAEGVRREIREWIVSCRIVPDEEKTPDLAEALRAEAAWSDDETCAKLASWIHAAIGCKPDLMRNFRMVGNMPKDPTVLLLEPIRTGTDERDAVGLWMG